MKLKKPENPGFYYLKKVMIKPVIVHPEEQVNQVGKVFDAPLVTKGLTWLPFTQVLVWGIMSHLAGKRRPERTARQRLFSGAITMPVVLGSEWLHNLAHAAAASFVGKPVNCIRIVGGMPLLVYYDVNDLSVSPQQHIIRAIGGPLLNALVLPFAWLVKRFSAPDSIWRDVGEAAYGMNLFLSTVSMLPIPFIDGGPVLKWSLVAGGRTVEQAEQRVQKVNLGMGIAMAGGAVAARKRKPWLAGLSALFAVTAIAVGLGWVKEQG